MKKLNLTKRIIVLVAIVMVLLSFYSCQPTKRFDLLEEVKNKNYDVSIYYSSLPKPEKFTRVKNEYLFYNDQYLEYFVVNGDSANYTKFYQGNMLEQKTVNPKEYFNDIVELLLQNNIFKINNYNYVAEELTYFLRKEVFKKVETVLNIQNLNSFTMQEVQKTIKINIVYKTSEERIDSIEITISNIGQAKIEKIEENTFVE